MISFLTNNMVRRLWYSLLMSRSLEMGERKCEVGVRELTLFVRLRGEGVINNVIPLKLQTVIKSQRK